MDRQVLVVEVVIARGDVDIELQSPRVQVSLQLGRQRTESRLGGSGKALEIQAHPAVFVGRQEEQELLAEVGARRRIHQEPADVEPLVADGLEVVHQGKNFRLRLRLFEERHHLVIDRLHFAILHHIEKGVQQADALQVAVCRHEVQPLRKEQVDLRVISFQRREAARVPGDVERPADAFFRIQHHLRGRRLAPAVGGSALRGMLPLFLLDGVVGTFLIRQPQAGKRLAVHQGENEYDDGQRHQRRQHVENDAQALPALALRVMKYGFSHGQEVG